ncbi:hypothetical protein ROZALSC1DRAFT_31758 [Rozella allomycis CSF55]|uniref:Uncharacterized protein n=1 Tax=Rozella allomycis (strain CSF55) TaxID=988480 RepID=A0A075B475_ROZAC|nr:hypothetical protein O9G_003994 [Rozella allomycis CSF55]RKP16214.1 hypothetical protein ROZALSC1DRAFT_31758 [Rozella allomycis CSF55]|eukprot:EPZ35941.1 hypothetical protein O9G_003994 [Rozella allomycis CSF55]
MFLEYLELLFFVAPYYLLLFQVKPLEFHGLTGALNILSMIGLVITYFTTSFFMMLYPFLTILSCKTIGNQCKDRMTNILQDAMMRDTVQNRCMSYHEAIGGNTMHSVQLNNQANFSSTYYANAHSTINLSPESIEGINRAS